MATSKATRMARVLFPVAVIVFIAATTFGMAIHWSSWLMLVSAGLILASNAMVPRVSEYLVIGAAVLSVAAFIGVVASTFQ